MILPILFLRQKRIPQITLIYRSRTKKEKHNEEVIFQDSLFRKKIPGYKRKISINEFLSLIHTHFPPGLWLVYTEGFRGKRHALRATSFLCTVGSFHLANSISLSLGACTPVRCVYVDKNKWRCLGIKGCC